MFGPALFRQDGGGVLDHDFDEMARYAAGGSAVTHRPTVVSRRVVLAHTATSGWHLRLSLAL